MGKHTLNAKAAGLALGVLSAAGVFLLGLFAMGGWGGNIVSLIGDAYIGYDASFGGAIIGAIWAFVDGFIGGYVGVWLYNKFLG